MTRSPFPRKRFQGTAASTEVGAKYRRLLNRYPFFVFGLPFILTMVAGSFFLTPAAAIRYEKHDRKTHALDREDALGLSRMREASAERAQGRGGGGAAGGLRGDIREEYWRLAGQATRLDDWEPKRIKRLPGEPDGTFD